MGTYHMAQNSRWRTVYYWTLLILTLLLLDDLVFGPIFWAMSQYNMTLSFAVAMVASWSYGFWLLNRGLQPTPGRLASYLLDRLNIRSNRELELREQSLRGRITSVAWAVLLSLLIGGTLAVLTLWSHQKVTAQQARRLGFWLCGLYSLEFASLHALGGGQMLSGTIELLGRLTGSG